MGGCGVATLPGRVDFSRGVSRFIMAFSGHIGSTPSTAWEFPAYDPTARARLFQQTLGHGGALAEPHYYTAVIAL
jgi:hypothetical protein